MSLLPAVCAQRWLALGILVFSFASTSSSLAQVTFYSGDPVREERRQEKLRIRAEREARAREREAERHAQRMKHPLGFAVIASPDLFALGMGEGYVGGFAGLGAGLRMKREFDNVSLRVSTVGRFARGSVSGWGINDVPPGRSPQTLWGAELQTELAFRSGGFFGGPTFSAGYLHLRADTLDERDFPEYRYSADGSRVARIPGHASFVTTGLVLGGEGRASNGRVSGAVRLTGGPWNDMHHAYLQLSITIGVVFWENER